MASGCAVAPIPTSLKDKIAYLYEMRTGDERPIDGFRPDYLALLNALNRPHMNLPPVIHVAGTNGKGSTIAFMRSILEVAGYRVHVFTSPHLERLNERIVLAGEEMSDDMLESLIDEVLAANKDRPLTFFECITAIAFTAFSRTPADIILLETGMGGRLDCTNVIPAPLASIITPVSFDHMEFLGTTLPAIAKEKSGIIKSGSFCVTSTDDNSVRDVLKNAAKANDSILYCYNRDWRVQSDGSHMTLMAGGYDFTYPLPNLMGPHQIINAATAIMCLKQQTQFTITDGHIAQGITHAHWPARLESITAGKLHEALPAGTELLYDGGHNEAAAIALASQAALWVQQDDRPLHLIFGMKHNKDIGAFISPLAPYMQSIAIVENDGFYTAKEACQTLENVINCPIFTFETATQYAQTIEKATKCIDRRILLCGSLYFKNMKNIF